MSVGNQELQAAIQKLTFLILEGLRHGFFECTVSSEIINGQRRRLVIKAGISHQFTVRPEELDDMLSAERRLNDFSE